MIWLLTEGAASRIAQAPFGPLRLTDAARAAGHQVITTRWAEGGADFSGIPEGAPCALYGSHRFLSFAAAARPDLAPGVFWGPIPCGHAAVSAALGPMMLNAAARVLPLSEARTLLRDGEPLFLRPERSDKGFAGAVFNGPSEALANLPGDLTVVAAPVAKIRAEYRFIIVDGQVRAGSQYARGGMMDVRVDSDPECAAFAQSAADAYAPLGAFVCDVADTPDGPRVIEYNGFGSAGLYACDCRPVVKSLAAFLS